MKKQSDKQRIRNEAYHEIAYHFLQENPYCEKCGTVAGEVHHKQGRLGALLTDVNKFMAVCYLCHRYIHDNPAESYKKGWLIHKNKKE